MSETADSAIEQVRAVLLGAERDALGKLHGQLDDLAAAVAEHRTALEATPPAITAINDTLAGLKVELTAMSARVESLESMIVRPEERTTTVSEVLVGAVADDERDLGVLGAAMQPEVEHAIHLSARSESTVLAEALYPVMGPAIRKMIAGLFTLGDPDTKADHFVVSEVLLIERSSGVLLAASPDLSDAADSDNLVVSGMLDAIRLFVEEAFDSPEHDGLRDLRVGETTVLVEWGPKALLASVVRGIPTDTYRIAAAETLEQLHRSHAEPLADFDGRVQPFATTAGPLNNLRKGVISDRHIAKRFPVAVAVAVVLAVAVAAMLVLL